MCCAIAYFLNRTGQAMFDTLCFTILLFYPFENLKVFSSIFYLFFFSKLSNFPSRFSKNSVTFQQRVTAFCCNKLTMFAVLAGPSVVAFAPIASCVRTVRHTSSFVAACDPRAQILFCSLSNTENGINDLCLECKSYKK